MNVEPDGLDAIGFHFCRSDRIQSVGKQDRVLSAFIGIGHNIAHKILLYGRSRDDVLAALEVADRERDVFHFFLRSEDSLC